MTDEEKSKQLQAYIGVLTQARTQLEFDLLIASNRITELDAEIKELRAVKPALQVVD